MSEDWKSLEALGYAALGTNAATLVAVVGLGVVVLVMLRRVVGNNLEQMAENLPKVVALIEASELDMAVLIAVCEEKGTKAEELAAMFQEDSDRKAVVERRFGSKSRLTKRFLQWDGSKFLNKGYPAEKFLPEYLTKADVAQESPSTHSPNTPINHTHHTYFRQRHPSRTGKHVQ